MCRRQLHSTSRGDTRPALGSACRGCGRPGAVCLPGLRVEAVRQSKQVLTVVTLAQSMA